MIVHIIYIEFFVRSAHSRNDYCYIRERKLLTNIWDKPRTSFGLFIYHCSYNFLRKNNCPIVRFFTHFKIIKILGFDKIFSVALDSYSLIYCPLSNLKSQGYLLCVYSGSQVDEISLTLKCKIPFVAFIPSWMFSQFQSTY